MYLEVKGLKIKITLDLYWALNPMADVFARERAWELETEAETRVMTGAWKAPKVREVERILLTPSQGASPCPRLDVGCQASGQKTN